MPVLDGDFEAFVTNLGKYNEGMLVGEWVKFPTTEEEMQKVFERIGIGKQDEFGQPYEEWFITDYECPIYGVQKMLGEYESLDKLNYLAALIDELSLSDQEKLVAIMEAGCDEVSDIDDLINLTFNLDCYDIMPGINDESDLGYKEGARTITFADLQDVMKHKSGSDLDCSAAPLRNDLWMPGSRAGRTRLDSKGLSSFKIVAADAGPRFCF